MNGQGILLIDKLEELISEQQGCKQKDQEAEKLLLALKNYVKDLSNFATANITTNIKGK